MLMPIIAECLQDIIYCLVTHYFITLGLRTNVGTLLPLYQYARQALVKCRIITLFFNINF